MPVVPRTVKQRSEEFVTGVVTELTGQDISGCTFEVAHILDTDKTDDPNTYPWEAPHAESGPGSSNSIYLARKLVEAPAVTAKTKYRVFAKITDSPEIPIIDCGTYSIVP